MGKNILNLWGGRTRRALVDGTSKTLYEGPEPGTQIHYYKDDMRRTPTEPPTLVAGKGVLNNRISAYLMTQLDSIGVPTHFIRSVNMREQMVHALDMSGITLVVRNTAAGPFAERLGLDEGTVLPQPIIEFFLKNPQLKNPWVTEDHLLALGWLHPYELDEIMNLAHRINDFLCGLMTGVGLRLVDIKLEFGRLWGEMDELYILLGDELSPDTMRLWDRTTNERLDRDRHRLGLGGVAEAYQQVADRLGLLPKGPLILDGAVNEHMMDSLDDIANRPAGERKLRAVPKAPPPSRR